MSVLESVGTVLEALEARRRRLVLEARRALLLAALRNEASEASADDVRAVVDIPPGMNPNALGAMPGPLARAGLIALARVEASTRPERRGSFVRVWRLRDRNAALRWLFAHPVKK